MLSRPDEFPVRQGGLRWFDNGPVQRLGDEVLIRVRQLGFKGCEVLQLRLDAFKAVILVDGPGRLRPEFQEGGFAGVQWGAVRVLWRVKKTEQEQGGES